MPDVACDVCSVVLPLEETSTCEECEKTLCLNCNDTTFGYALCDECATEKEDAAIET